MIQAIPNNWVDLFFSPQFNNRSTSVNFFLYKGSNFVACFFKFRILGAHFIFKLAMLLSSTASLLNKPAVMLSVLSTMPPVRAPLSTVPEYTW